MRKPSSVKLLTAVTSTGAGASHELWNSERTYQFHGVTSAGAGSLIASIEVSNDSANGPWITMGTVTLVLSTTTATDGFSSIVPWRYTRANVTTLSGTGATATVIAGNLAS